jgi:hypothetical protein
MLAVDEPIVQRLRQPPERPQEQNTPEAGSAAGEQPLVQEEPFILCRDCLHPITRPSDRVSIEGRHAHTFANPHGIVFEIGCFRRAPGCGAIGPASSDFTWFAGHRWRVCICAACLVHLGWVFLPAVGDVFYGLILERLREPSP